MPIANLNVLAAEVVIVGPALIGHGVSIKVAPLPPPSELNPLPTKLLFAEDVF